MNNEIENIISHIQPEEDSEKMLNYIEELEQQNKELIEALNSACLNCHRFCDEECHAYFIKHKFTIGGERCAKQQEERDE